MNLRNLITSFACAAMLAGVNVHAAESMPRPEYPRPQFERQQWQNLNGTWTYQFDFGKSGKENNFQDSHGFSNNIIVPFCPESSLSGVGHTDFIEAMWYHRKLNVPAEWAGKKVLLHFGGVDYRAEIFLNGKSLFTHYGGGSSFNVDITKALRPDGGENDLVVYVEDNLRSWQQTGGKQSRRLNSYECLYTRVTGIWQTVWMEAVDKTGLRNCRITPDLDNSQFVFEPEFFDIASGNRLRIRVLDEGREVCRREVAASNNAVVTMPIKKVKTWSPESPFLYDVQYTVLDAQGNEIDHVDAYAGMRKCELRGTEFYLNNEPYYQRLVLDQGYYPDGQWTAPDDSQLRRDIELAKQAGFNGARLHQKVFEPRYFYWADHLGYLTWGESASWGMNWNDKVSARNLLAEWQECVARDYNVPSIVAWSPLNEMHMPDPTKQNFRLANDLYAVTKNLDRTRPVATVSGGFHSGQTDIWTEHTYVQDPVKLYQQLAINEQGSPFLHHPQHSVEYNGASYMIDEFGGIKWEVAMEAPEVADSQAFWGYGVPPRTLEEFYDRLEKQVNVMLSHDHISGFCYTQIVDVELEKNGIFTYDRAPKFDMDRIHAIFTKSREQAKAEVAAMLENAAAPATDQAAK